VQEAGAESRKAACPAYRWRDETVRAGRKIARIALAFEAGRDGFWLARWLSAKTDRLDTELLKRGFLGWLRGERGHCTMARVPTTAEEDAKRPNRERECLARERTRIVNRMKGTLALSPIPQERGLATDQYHGLGGAFPDLYERHAHRQCQNDQVGVLFLF
jgi:transposase